MQPTPRGCAALFKSSTRAKSSVLTRAALGLPRDSKTTRVFPYATLLMRLDSLFFACPTLTFSEYI